MNATTKLVFATGLALSGAAFAATPSLDLDRAYAAELRADAARHTSLLQATGSGYDGKFHIGDAAGNYRLDIQGLFQTRYTAGFRDDDDLGSGSEGFAHGFDAHRVQLRFGGHVGTPNLTYRLTFDYGSNSDAADTIDGNLRDAWAQYNFEGEAGGFYVRWGQFHAPIFGEWNVADEYQQGVERSVVSQWFNPGWTQGAILGYEADAFRIQGIVSDGVDFGGTWSPNSTYSGADVDYSIGARADILLSGDWRQFSDFASFRGSDSAFRVGGGFNWQSGGDTGTASGAPTFDATYTVWTIDAAYQGDGWNLYGAYLGHTLDVDSGINPTNHAFQIQGGLFVADQVELYGRYELFLPDDDELGSSEDSYSYVTFGLNYFITPESHTAKVSADILWAVDDTYDGLNSGFEGSTGLLGGSDDEILFRAQVQVLW